MKSSERMTKEQFAYAKQADEAAYDLARHLNCNETRIGRWHVDKPKRITGGWRGRVTFWGVA